MDNLDTVDQKIAETLKEHGAQMSFEFSFPRYKILPDEVQLALRILRRHGMNIVLAIKPKENPPKQQ